MITTSFSVAFYVRQLLPISNLFIEAMRKVRKWSTIQAAGRTYSVPSRLIGKEVKIRLYSDHLEVYYKGHLVERMARVHGEGETGVNYRHVIGSLVRKPGAFARYRFREQLFPTRHFRMAYDALREWRGERADVEYVRILHLAAKTMEATVDPPKADCWRPASPSTTPRYETWPSPRCPRLRCSPWRASRT